MPLRRESDAVDSSVVDGPFVFPQSIAVLPNHFNALIDAESIILDNEEDEEGIPTGLNAGPLI